MRIRTKVLMVVLPLLVFPLFLIGYTSYLSARSGITKIAEEFLKYKTLEMFKFCRRQEDILADAGLNTAGEYRQIAQQSAEDYANSIRLSETGYFMAVDSQGKIVFPEEAAANLSGAPFFETMKEKKVGLLDFIYKGSSRVGYFVYFPEWDWYLLLSEQEKTFFQDADDIKRQVAFTLGVTFLFATGLILYFIKKLTDPVGNVVSTMKEIITSSDLSKRVRVEYDDEIGSLATWFNRMVEDLEIAYNQIKQYAYQSVLAQKSEERIRLIFQKYVPAEVIDEVLKLGADRLLVGKKQTATILFSDIRGFTSISEKLSADQLVTSLNAYFNIMVGIIMEYEGMIDKFIGDAIMAIFGAPVLHQDDPMKACLTSFKMLDSLKGFNRKQTLEGRPTFKIGIGLNTGEVVIGNIGSTQKLDYTVIGDTVNLASRLEGLTKLYGVDIIISEYTFREAKSGITARELGAVRVKGKARPVKIYQPFMDMTGRMKQGYEVFSEGMLNYRNKNFRKAQKHFSDAKDILGKDTPSVKYMEWCEELIKNPPGDTWDGAYVAEEK
jgi:class 3 adenylate cyclase/HAMP domain-containing protein